MLNKRERLITGLLFLTISIFLIFDIYEDLHEGASFEHVFEEAIIMIIGFIGAAYLWFKLLFIKKENIRISANVSKLKTDLQNFKEQTKNLSEGISDKINEQLDDWNLTKSEKDIALLLLKGLSIKEIADIRSTAEKTIKQHCTKIYQKSNLSGRSELSAFFLEDILVIR
ncbi:MULTISPECIES: helix-turn-helix transcriptional regulator [Halobacteriovorax]|uniref:LuxR family transcriptional regulator n=1 Tax=Halobacteriovorax vibrionivorans TaxID=2152716 RepID=A0ABY0IIR4_9BACT|nr:MULTISPECIES: helix-turn-helix transcriptional regulator [Halobacteriovorax]AYF44030.1 transcriptional regulator, LuxR family [Halobacteriovorax sp. BALOs_7]RZF21444.1 LuxR family transcriptional regulator [Halobacteriovorax vibrionivorans]TGD48717.1 LuxR family transcriptional regulator [Halobacteriovorax sp. Y22]